MNSRWFRLPETGSGTDSDPTRPDLLGYTVDGTSGNKSHPDGAPHFVVRVFADETTLDNLAGEPDAQAYDNVPTTALNQMFGQERDSDGWQSGFEVR